MKGDAKLAKFARRNPESNCAGLAQCIRQSHSRSSHTPAVFRFLRSGRLDLRKALVEEHASESCCNQRQPRAGSADRADSDGCSVSAADLPSECGPHFTGCACSELEKLAQRVSVCTRQRGRGPATEPPLSALGFKPTEPMSTCMAAPAADAGAALSCWTAANVTVEQHSIAEVRA